MNKAKQARRAIVQALVGAGATIPARAARLDAGAGADPRMLRRMLRFGAVVETRPGLYYLDAERLDGFRGALRRRRATLWAALSGMLGTAVTALLVFGIAE
ncbi:hypothetical protein [uncultured Sphingomonas sp.]|uniref:hypothetical protein n=1 Tax=Sphingomonas sp. TaxID=28214 RepID=UPI002619F595|nr:hypothetical protein [uncultured Sphingomonas sp.]